MTRSIGFELTDTQYDLLRAFAVDPEAFTRNFILTRIEAKASAAVTAEVSRRLAAGEPVPQTREEIIEAAIASGVVTPLESTAPTPFS